MHSAFGFWSSPISAEAVSKGTAGYSFTEMDGDRYFWLEMRPEEKGRYALMSQSGEVLPNIYNVRSRVHEYGGRAYTVHQGVVYFINFTDQALYRMREGKIDQITDGSIFFAELTVTDFGIIAVAERQGENFLALINPESGEVQKFASGHDFYAAPALSPDGKKLAWITWNHPNMPWDETELWVADFSDGKPVLETGGASIFQPSFSPEGKLHYVSDKSGWWNLYREGEALYPCSAEFGAPLWVLGMKTYGFMGNDVVASYQKEGKYSILSTPFEAAIIQSFVVKEGKALFIAGFSDRHTQVIVWDGSTFEVVCTNSAPIDPGYCSIGVPITFPGIGHDVYGYYYPPVNKDYSGSIGKPPLLVKAHGGPTAQANNSYSATVQYWTSRGFALVDVNYGGSSGYGRAYRDLLKGQWGIIDWQDCEAAVKYLSPDKAFIEGSSAGGYTVLCALTFGSAFAGGSSHYGISDLILLTGETHKFECRYMDQLIGPYPEFKAVYEARSPLYHAELCKKPVILFQGEEDLVVPPNQAKEFAEKVNAELVLYPAEQHGFRQAATIQNVLEKELLFYQNILRD